MWESLELEGREISLFIQLMGPEGLAWPISKPLVEDFGALLHQSSVGFLQRVELHILSPVESNFLGIGYNPRVNVSQITFSAKERKKTHNVNVVLKPESTFAFPRNIAKLPCKANKGGAGFA